MTDNKLAIRGSSEITLPSQERSITYPQPKQLFRSCETEGQKQEATIAALTRLAALVNATSEPGRLIAVSEVVCDMHPRALQLAFEHLERNHAIAALPAPADIRRVGEELHGQELRQQFRQHLDAQAGARHRRLAERVEAGEDQYYGLADLAKFALEKFGMKVGEDKNKRETQALDDKQWAERKAELQRQQEQLLKEKQA